MSTDSHHKCCATAVYVDGYESPCVQDAMPGSDLCYYHSKVMRGLTTPDYSSLDSERVMGYKYGASGVWLRQFEYPPYPLPDPDECAESAPESEQEAAA